MITQNKKELAAQMLKIAADVIDTLVGQVKEASGIMEDADKVSKLESMVEELQGKLGSKIAADPYAMMEDNIDPEMFRKVANHMAGSQLIDEVTDTFGNGDPVSDLKDFFASQAN
jgi:hypothetical protein